MDPNRSRVLEGELRQQPAFLSILFRCVQFFKNLSKILTTILNRGGEATEIDPGISDLVSAMNKSGVIRTSASCQGHPKRAHPPYVYFSSSQATAIRIEKFLRIWGRGSEKRLSVSWQLAGQFDENCQLKFCLHAPEYHERAKSLAGAAIQFYFKKTQVQRDLKTLTELIRQMVLDNRQNNKNKKRGRNSKKKPKYDTHPSTFLF